MKRFLAFLLVFVMIFSLVSCSSGEGAKEKEKETETDISSLSAEDFYAFGVEKNRGLTSARYVTEIFLGESRLYEIWTTRVRSGYDGFSYSRVGKDYFCFTENTAYVENENGRFTATQTAREFEEYLSEHVFSLYGLEGEKIEKFSREGNKVFYESSSEALLAPYEKLSEKGDFSPLQLKGEADLSKEGIIEKEALLLLGKNGSGEEVSYRLETKLSEYRSEDIEVVLPENKETFEPIQDIRIPDEILSANKKLLSKETFHSGQVISESVSLGGNNYNLSQDKNIYQLTQEEGVSSYYSIQSLKQFGANPEESLFYQALTEKGTTTENTYNLITATLLSENTGTEGSKPYLKDLEKLLLLPSDMKNIVKEEVATGISLRFELSEKAIEKLLKNLCESMAESTLLPQSCQGKEGVGTLSIDRESGMLSSISYSLSGSCNQNEQSGTFSTHISVLTDPKEEVQIPSLQIPTPTTPGMAVDGH